LDLLKATVSPLQRLYRITNVGRYFKCQTKNLRVLKMKYWIKRYHGTLEALKFLEYGVQSLVLAVSEAVAGEAVASEAVASEAVAGVVTVEPNTISK
jgi:hypothetical protein